MVLASVDTAGTAFGGPSSNDVMSDDGRYVAFYRWETGRDATPAGAYVFDATTGLSTYYGALSLVLDISGDGRFLLARSRPNDNLIRLDRTTGAEVAVVVNRDGSATTVSCTNGTCNGDRGASMSADGRYVAFGSVEPNLVVGDTNGMSDVFIRDMIAASTVRASVTTAGVQGSNGSSQPTLSDDGKRVAFLTLASNMPGAMDARNDKHVIRDLTAGTTVSVASPMTGAVTGSAMGGDGSVVFATAEGLVPTDTDGANDVYVRRPDGRFVRVTNGMGPSGWSLDAGSVSATGRFVGFTTNAGVVPEDTNGYSDLYLWDSASRILRRLSVTPTGEQITYPGGFNGPLPGAFGPVHVSADGRSVSFDSTLANLIPNGYNNDHQILIATNDIPPVTPVGAGDTTGGNNPAENHAQCCVKDPINTATGELWEAVTDLSVSGRLPVVASRTYSSMRAGTAGLFGAGWSSPWDMAVTASDTSTAVLQENGSRVVFTPGPNGTFTTPLSGHATLTRDTGTGEYTYVRRSDTTFRFDNTGRLISIADRNGETTTLSRPAGQLSVTSADGRVLTLNLEVGGTIGSLSGPEGRTISYTYGAGGLLEQVLDSRGKTWTYRYDPTTKRMTSSTSPLGEVTTTEYDTAGRVSAQTDRMGRVSRLGYTVDGDRTTTRLTEPTGVVTLHKYWRGLLVARVVDPDGTPATWQYTYDIGNNLASSIDPTGVTTTATFDDAGNPLIHTDGAGNTTTITYNQFNRPLSIKDPAGHSSIFTYDSVGNLLTTTVPQSATVTAGTTLTRDTAHRGDVLSVEDADNRVSSMTYTAQGFAASRTAGDGGKETFTYDAYGAVLTRVAPKGNVTGGTPATYTTTNTYDSGGLQLTGGDPLTHVTTFGYDDDGRLTSTQDPYSKTTTTAYFPDGTVKSVTDPMLRKTQFTHDGSGKELIRTAPDGGVTTRTYDSHGQLATILKPSGNAAGATAIEKAARTITYGYDLAGRGISATQPDPSNPGALLVQSSTYDAAGRLWKSTTAVALTTTTTYDSLGRVVTVTDPAGKLTTFGYDWAGHRTSTTDPLSHTTTVTYSPAGQVTATADPLANTTKFTYDPAGRPLTTISPRGTCATCTPLNYTRTRGYDLNGNLTSSKDELGRTTTHTYDAADRHVTTVNAKSRTTTLTHDDAGRLKTVKAPDTGTTTYSYTDAGDLTGATGPRLKATTYGYDSAGRPNSVIDALGRQRTRTYTLDGQVATDVTARGNAGATPVIGMITYTHDAAARPTGVSFGDGQPAVSFGYDSASRRTSMTDGVGTQTYTYDANSRVTGIGRGSSGWVYTYYDDGTINTRTRPDATLETHTYDLAGRPKTAVTPAGTTSYGWDADRNLVTSALPNGTTETQTWDRSGHLSKVATTSGSKVVVSQTLARDATNNPLETVTLRGRATDTRSFKYDPNDRLQGVCHTTQTACTGSAAATQWWTYDLDGNRTTEKNGTSTGTTTTYTYDDASQLAGTKVGTAVPRAHTYDADGNQLSDGTVTATYDLNNRAKTSTSGVTTTTWQRDGEGNPLSQATGATTTQYRWDLNARVPRLASTTDAVSTTSYRYDPLGRPATLSSGTVHETAAHDPLGAPIDLISSAGAIVRSADWTPFGTDRAAIGAPASPTGPTSTIGFAGMVKGPSSSYLTRDRTYTPATGRWTATDPITPGVGASFDSPYTYVGNRPGLFTDPLGQCIWQLLQCGGALDDIGQASRGAGDAGGQMVKDAAITVLHPDQLVEDMVDAYRAEGFWYAANQLNPVHHTIDRYSAMWALANQGCIREAAAAGTNGAIAAATTVAGAAGVARGLAGRGVAGRGEAAAETAALTEREIGTAVDDVLEGASFYKQSQATQYLKPGGFGQANADFDALTQGVNVIERGGGLRTATLSNGTKINVRPFSSGKSPTLEIDTPGNPALKIRY